MNENPTHSLGAFFICYKERNAIEHSVASFFEHYPEAPMYLSSDGGFDYAYLTEKFANLRTSLDDEQTVGLTVDVSKHTRLHPLFMASFAFLNRVRLAIEFTKTSHLLLMEPDVLIRGKLTIPDAELVGPLPCENEMPEVIQLLIGDWGGRNCRYWGAAAGLMQTRAFIEIYEDLRQQPWILLEALEYDRRIACYDYLLTFLFSLYGYRYEENPDLVECLRNPDWRTSAHPLVHQYREFYISGTGDTGKHHIGA